MLKKVLYQNSLQWLRNKMLKLKKMFVEFCIRKMSVFDQSKALSICGFPFLSNF